MKYGLNRLTPRMGAPDTCGGWRVLLPVYPVYRKDYAPSVDAFVTGWWWLSVGFSLEGIGFTQRHGIAFRITWGLIPTRRTEAKAREFDSSMEAA